MNKNKRLMLAIGEIDEKYVKESEGKMLKSPIIKVAVCLVLVVAFGLHMFLPFAPVTSDLTAYEGSSYFPLIEGIEDYRLSFKQPKYKNNFEAMLGIIEDLNFGANLGGSAPDMDMNGSEAPESGMDGNGSYVESTDNQVEGVIESDLMKMTDKYIFRLGIGYTVTEYEKGNETYKETVETTVLNVYSIDKENSTLVAKYEIPHFENEFFKSYYEGEMYLSLDGNTVTLLKYYTDSTTNKGKIGIISIDVSDINNINTKAMVSIDGQINTSRMADGRLLLISEYFFNRNKVDYNDPATFVPSIDSGNGPTPIEFEDIIFPDIVGNTRYSVVALFDADNLELLGANALLNFTNQVYVSANNVYITRQYNEKFDQQDNYNYTTKDMTDIAVLNYSGDRLENKGIITVEGHAEDQYSFDEKDGYLRLVTTTTESIATSDGSLASGRTIRNASLWIYDLADNSLAYSLEDFAIEGEEATAVRFDGDMLYVCTAVVINFTDPVYFIDLSDYENIDSADTGIIEGYSDHLINLGEGFLLGIGQENRWTSKVEIYEQQGSDVVSVDVFKFEGSYSDDYKAYLVNREQNIFGFGADYIYIYDEQTFKEEVYYDCYILLQFNGYELTAQIFKVDSLRSASVRAAYVDGYLYITTEYNLTVEKIN